MTAPVEVGDMVRLNIANWERTKNAMGLVTAIDDAPDEPDRRWLTVQSHPGGETYWWLSDVVRIDMPRVQPGQVWTCDRTGSTIRVREVSWYCPIAWETETLAPAGRNVGTLILGGPAWRFVAEAE